jgi:outer membrane protein TolC
MLKITSLFPQDSLIQSDALPLSMEDTWHKASEHSKKIELRHFEEEVSKEEIREAQFERLPEVTIKGHIEYASNLAMYTKGLFEKPEQHEVIHMLYRIGTDIYINIYNGNKLNLTIDKRKFLHEIAEEQKNYTASEIKLQASTYYLHLQRSIIFKELMIKDIANQEKQLVEIRQLLKNGVVLKSDELRVELKLSNQKMMLVQIENDIAIANQKLNILIGLSDNQIILPTEKIKPQTIPLNSYEEYLKEAMEKSYEYHISEKRTEISKIQLQYTRANVRPKVGFYGDLFLANPQIFLFPYSPSNYTLGIFGIKASLPISEFYMNKPKTKIAILELEKEELEHHDTDDKIRQQVYESYLRFKEALINIDVARVNVEQAEENARIIKHNYFNQTVLITDLLDADILVIQTKLEFISSEIEAQKRYYQLQNIIGNL